MKYYITIDGEKMELAKAQLEKLGIFVQSKKNPFNRVEKNEKIYYINAGGEIGSTNEFGTHTDDCLYNIANYCTDKDLIEQRALHETLNRLLWRFTYENGWNEEYWDNTNMHKYYIIYDVKHKEFDIDYWSYTKFDGAIYFKDGETAQRAIDEIIKPFMKEHLDFVW